MEYTLTSSERFAAKIFKLWFDDAHHPERSRRTVERIIVQEVYITSRMSTLIEIYGTTAICRSVRF